LVERVSENESLINLTHFSFQVYLKVKAKHQLGTVFGTFVTMSFSQELYTPLIESINSLVDISEQEIELVISSFRPKMIAKKEFLLNRGDVSNHMRFIAEGCLRSYTLDNKVQEHILQFGIKGWWINDLYSYLTWSKEMFPGF